MVNTKDIKQTVMLKNVDPREVYEMLMDSKKHAKFTVAGAKIGRKVGDKISAYDGWIQGENMEVIPDKKIVQKWRGDDWPSGHYSIATFDLVRDGSDTILTFTQTGVPSEQYDAINDGWVTEYWDKMKEFLERNS